MTRQIQRAAFAPGMKVRHKQFGYIGLVYDVDAEYGQSDEWYEMMSNSAPKKQAPWYHILVDGETHTTYVAEEYLNSAEEFSAIDHPLVDSLFKLDGDSHYHMRNSIN